MQRHSRRSASICRFPIPLIISVVITGLVGLAVALPSMRISGIYLVITTLALQVITIDVLINWTSLTGGPTGISNVPPVHCSVRR